MLLVVNYWVFLNVSFEIILFNDSNKYTIIVIIITIITNIIIIIITITLLDLAERNANHIIPSCCHLPVSYRSLVDRCGSLGSCKPQI